MSTGTNEMSDEAIFEDSVHRTQRTQRERCRFLDDLKYKALSPKPSAEGAVP